MIRHDNLVLEAVQRQLLDVSELLMAGYEPRLQWQKSGGSSVVLSTEEALRSVRIEAPATQLTQPSLIAYPKTIACAADEVHVGDHVFLCGKTERVDRVYRDGHDNVEIVCAGRVTAWKKDEILQLVTGTFS
jgi:hypothetical protein